MKKGEPGPGAYKSSETLNDKISTQVHSMKGSGSFASSAGRQQIKLNDLPTPGAGAYNVEQADFSKKKDFSKGLSSTFKAPIAVQIEKESTMPAPNAYDLSNKSKFQFRENKVCAESAFKSKTKREMILRSKTNMPAPGTYDIAGDLINPNSVAYASFKSTTQRRSFTPKNSQPG